jgi:hypothetical protein
MKLLILLVNVTDSPCYMQHCPKSLSQNFNLVVLHYLFRFKTLVVRNCYAYLVSFLYGVMCALAYPSVVPVLPACYCDV